MGGSAPGPLTDPRRAGRRIRPAAAPAAAGPLLACRPEMTKPGILAAGIGCAGALCALLGWRLSGPWSALAWWTALSCAVASAAYLANRPDWLPKRDGRLVWWRALPLLPYLLAYRVGVFVRRARRRHAPWDEVTPGLFVGACVEAGRLPPGTSLVLDLTSEWAAPPCLRALPGYRSLPVLDGAYPHDEEQFLELLAELSAAEGGVYVHCESGKGRAPTAAALLLLGRGVVRDADAAIELVLKNRPVARLTATDLRFIRRLARRIAPLSP